MQIRQITFYENHFEDFFYQQTQKVKDKINGIFFLIKNVERVPEKFLQHLEGTEGYMKSGLNREVIFFESSVVSMKEN